jgi:signal transduction histidine kinase
MEKETKRGLQNVLEILREQQETIRQLERKTMRSMHDSNDGLSTRIERIAQEINERDAFEIDWGRLCDRHYAKRS